MKSREYVMKGENLQQKKRKNKRKRIAKLRKMTKRKTIGGRLSLKTTDLLKDGVRWKSKDGKTPNKTRGCWKQLKSKERKN